MDDRNARYIEIEIGCLDHWIQIMQRIDLISNSDLSKVYNAYICGPRWIYRGQSDANWVIESSFERNVFGGGLRLSESEYKAREKEAISYFKRSIGNRISNYPKTDGEWLALMRHYGVPSRFIDFTRAPFVALYFALQDTEEKDFAIWALHYNFNEKWIDKKIEEKNRASSFLKKGRIVIGQKCEIDASDTRENRFEIDEVNNQVVEDILSNKKREDLIPSVLSFEPNILNHRQRLQNALFLLSSHLSVSFMDALGVGDYKAEKLSIADIYNTDGEFVDKVANAELIKFKFKACLRVEAKSLLRISNVTHQVLFDDIEGVAMEASDLLKRCSNVNYHHQRANTDDVNKEC